MADDGPADAVEHLRLGPVRVRHAGQSRTLDDAVQQHRTCITPAVVGDAHIINNPAVLPRKADSDPNDLLSVKRDSRHDAVRRDEAFKPRVMNFVGVLAHRPELPLPIGELASLLRRQRGNRRQVVDVSSADHQRHATESRMSPGGFRGSGFPPSRDNPGRAPDHRVGKDRSEVFVNLEYPSLPAE